MLTSGDFFVATSGDSRMVYEFVKMDNGVPFFTMRFVPNDENQEPITVADGSGIGMLGNGSNPTTIREFLDMLKDSCDDIFCIPAVGDPSPIR